MINNTKSDILLRVIEQVYEQHLDMQDIINLSLVDICWEENVSPEMTFFAGFYHNGLF